MSDIETFKRRRNKAFIELDLDYAREMMPGASSDEVRIVAMHKARYECKDIPPELRQESRRWLTERGYGRLGNMPFSSDGALPE